MLGLSAALWRTESYAACSALLLLTSAPRRLRPDLQALPNWNLRSGATFHSPTTTAGSPVCHSEVVVPGLPASRPPKFPRTRSNSSRLKKLVTQQKPQIEFRCPIPFRRSRLPSCLFPLPFRVSPRLDQCVYCNPPSRSSPARSARFPLAPPHRFYC
jgi:hypothetical protein